MSLHELVISSFCSFVSKTQSTTTNPPSLSQVFIWLQCTCGVLGLEKSMEKSNEKKKLGNEILFCSTAKKWWWSRCFPFYCKYKLSPCIIGADDLDSYLTITMSNEIKTLWIDHVYPY